MIKLLANLRYNQKNELNNFLEFHNDKSGEENLNHFDSFGSICKYGYTVVVYMSWKNKEKPLINTFKFLKMMSSVKFYQSYIGV